jgi:N-acetylglucosaminyldiphosphoundecaprenol N-acetyl-beta-D-mannosaminyltransferase
MTIVALLDCPCVPFANEDAVKDRLRAIVAAGEGGYSVAINAEKIQRYDHDAALRSVIDGAALPVADGAGAVIGLRLLHGLRSAKIDLPRILLEAAHDSGWRLFVGGASQASNAGAVAAIARRYPAMQIVGRADGYVPEAELIAAVAAARPQVMLLAMGSPRQELLARRIIDAVPGVFIVGCGGALDILAGKLKRAPRFMVENNLEWLYRLAKEPSRWRRQLVLPRYMARLVAEMVATRARR